MTIRRRRQPTPHFKLPPPYNALTGERALLQAQGTYPHCAMMQVAAEDTHDDYVVCRGFDTRIKKFFDYDAEDLEKNAKESRRQNFMARNPGMSKGGPYIGKRGGKWADAQHTIPWKEGAGKKKGKPQGVE